MKSCLFVDLDDTLFQTRHKCRDDDDLEPAAYNRQGEALSFTTRPQRVLFDLLCRNMLVVPTTARDFDAFSRVTLPFNGPAILNFGGIVLTEDGRPDAAWLARMREQLAPLAEEMQALLVAANAFIDEHQLKAFCRQVRDFDTDFYLVAKYREGQTEALQQLEQQVVRPWLASRQGRFRLHINGNNLAVLPTVLDKAHAVQYLTERLRAEHGELITWGMGDSLSDAAFMALCDYSIVPRDTQLARGTVAGVNA